jgi:hypothetical protein
MRTEARLHRGLALIALSVLFVFGCSTPKEEGPEVTQLADNVGPASAVYLCDIVGRPSAAELRVRDVWRHAPRLGPAPVAGSRVDVLLNKTILEPTITAVLVFVYDPPLPLLNDSSMPNRTVFVFGDQVLAYHLSVAEVEKYIRSQTPPAGPK